MAWFVAIEKKQLNMDSLLLQSNMTDFVVWNPWKENAAKMSDFGNEEYPGMVCVEAAQASKRVSVAAKGGKFVASHTIAVMD